MKKKETFNYVLFAILIAFILFSCKKEVIKTAPVVSVTSPSGITANSASSGGNVSADGGAAVTSRGVCWSTDQNPTTSDSKTSDGSGVGSFSSSITGLNPGVTYTLKAYAINSVGTSYSSSTSFSTIRIPATITTSALSGITSNTAVSGGNIINDGGSPVSARGVCWSTSQNPTIQDSKTTDGSGSGSFISNVTGLTPGATYYIRAYATNNITTSYGLQVIAVMQTALATLTTTTIANITSSSVTGGGNIGNDGGVAITSRGVCWSTNQSPTTADSKTSDGSGTGSFTSSITGLKPGTLYYFRAYAINSNGPSYGNQVTATTIPVLPTLKTAVLSSITTTSATSGGAISDDGGASVTARGVCWNSAPSPTISNTKTTDGSGSGTFTSNISGLSANTTYYVRAYATNSVGTAYGNEISFITAANLPTVSTSTASSITATSAIIGGNVTADGGGVIIARGVCWSNNPSPTIAGTKTTETGTKGMYTSSLEGLTIGTTYYARAYATNSAGTGYGDQISFSTLCYISLLFNPNLTYGTLNDLDNNNYKTIQIGTQVWMAENLKTTKYNDGTPIPMISGNTSWAGLLTPGYCWYNNDEICNKEVYGAIYNWYAINTKKVCPTGWRIPTNDDWSTLTTFLGGNVQALDKLKETSINHWLAPNSSATNSSGFTAVPGGYRYGMDGTFRRSGSETNWWSSTITVTFGTQYINYLGINRQITSTTFSPGLSIYTVTDFGTPFGYSVEYNSYDNSQEGYSVRCIKN